MGKVSNHDMSKESISVQEFFQEARSILNNGTYELSISASFPPNYDAPTEPTLVLSKSGAAVRLYVGYLGTWYYVALST